MPKPVQVSREFVAPSQRSRLNTIACFPLVLLSVKETRRFPELDRQVSSNALALHRSILIRDQQLKSSRMTSYAKKRVGCSCVQYVSFRRTATFNIPDTLCFLPMYCTNNRSMMLRYFCYRLHTNTVQYSTSSSTIVL